MDLNAAAMFVAAVRAGSLSAAALQLGVPLPTVSRRIRQLERELGVQLLERSARGIQLTVAGMRLYEHTARGVELMAEGEQALRHDQTQLKGCLRLSLPPSFEPWWDLLRGFQQRYPEIRLSIYSTERRVNLIQDGIDVALRVGAIADVSMVARRMLVYRHVLVASPALLARCGEPVSVDELRRLPIAVWAADPDAQCVWTLGGQPFEPEPVLSTNDYAHLRSRAIEGEVVTELPPFLANDALRAGRLRRLLPDARLPEQAIHLLYPSHRHPSSIVRAYLDYCQAHVDTHLHSVE